MAKYAVILPAAGKSSRFRDKHYKKQFSILDNRTVWLHSAEKFLNRDDVSQLILVIAAEDREEFKMKFAANITILGVELVEGGKERADSIENALAKIREDVDFVAVHDAARPCIANEWIDKIFETAAKTGAAIPATRLSSTIKKSTDGKTINETVSREHLWLAQTPQVFRRDWLFEAYAKRDGFNATDDAQLIERLGHTVSLVEGSPLNIKITSKDDLRLAEKILKILPKPKLGGFGNPFEDNDMWK